MEERLIRDRFKKSDIQTHERLTVLGRTGTGKSFFTALEIKSLANKTPIILIDTKDEYKFIEPLPIEKLFKLKNGLYRINEIIYKNGVVVDDLRVICEFLCKNIFKFQKKMKEKNQNYNKGYILVIEEAGNIIRKTGYLYETMPYFAKVLLQGRSVNIGVICISQRPAQLHTDVINESDHIICFDLSGKHDIEAIKHWFNPEWFNDLNKHEFFHYSVKEKFKKHCYRLYPHQNDLEYYKKIFGKS